MALFVDYRLVQKKRTGLLSTSLAWPAVAGCSRAETFSQLSTISFAQPCTCRNITHHITIPCAFPWFPFHCLPTNCSKLLCVDHVIILSCLRVFITLCTRKLSEVPTLIEGRERQRARGMEMKCFFDGWRQTMEQILRWLWDTNLGHRLNDGFYDHDWFLWLMILRLGKRAAGE